MLQRLTPVASLLACALAVAALVVARQGPGREPEESSAAGPGVGGAEAVEGLRLAVRDLEERLDRLEAGGLAAPRVPAEALDEPVLRAELEALREEVREVAERGVASGLPGAGRPDLERAVRESVEGLERERKEQEAEAWRSERLRQFDELLPDVAEKLGLASNQMNALEAAVGRAYETQAAYGELKSSGQVTTAEQWETLLAADRDDFLSELGGFLSDEQLTEYAELGQGWVFPWSDSESAGK